MNELYSQTLWFRRVTGAYERSSKVDTAKRQGTVSVHFQRPEGKVSYGEHVEEGETHLDDANDMTASTTDVVR